MGEGEGGKKGITFSEEAKWNKHVQENFIQIYSCNSELKFFSLTGISQYIPGIGHNVTGILCRT